MRRHGSSERPTIIDDFVRALGAQSVSYKDKLTCCGAGGGVRAGSSDLALNYTCSKIENILHEGADCVVTPCAFCHFQFDAGQVELSETHGKQFKLPVVYLTQLLGLALGMSSEDVGLDGNKTQVQSLLEKLRVQQIAHAVKK
jgi:heterodisulfide reductase subunit B